MNEKWKSPSKWFHSGNLSAKNDVYFQNTIIWLFWAILSSDYSGQQLFYFYIDSNYNSLLSIGLIEFTEA